MVLFSQIFGTGLGVVAAELCTDEGSLGAVTLFLCVAMVGAIASLFVKEDLRRLKP